MHSVKQTIIFLSFVGFMLLASEGKAEVKAEGFLKASPASWRIENCKLIGKSADMEISTDGHLSHQTIHFRLVSDVPLKHAPEMQLNTAKFTGFELEGTGRGFGFDMVYTPMQVSYMLHENAALILGYEPIYPDSDGNYYTYHAVFPMNDVPEKLASLSNDCGY